MEKFIRSISCLLLLSLLLTACVREVWPEAGSEGIVINFGSDPSADVVVSTKGTLSESQESRVHNIYVFVFDSEGNKIFGHYYDEDNLNLGSGNYWTLTSNGISGTIHLKTSAENGCTIGAICNIDAEMVNISPEQLGTVKTWSDLQKLKATLNQLTLSRSGYFPMSGTLTGADLASGTWTGSTLNLKRLDAKIKFIVQVDPEATNIYDFMPKSWQVVNLPKTSYVLERLPLHSAGSEAAVSEDDFFDSETNVFETEDAISDSYYNFNNKLRREYGFSFYMMENRKAPKASPDGNSWTYADRSKQNKDSENRNIGGFQFANDLATYVIITGRLEFKSSATATSDIADVKYIIHLGDFGAHGKTAHADNSKFDVERNHTYTYKIYIKGVTDIYAEALGGAEADPGATGDILYSSGNIIMCDSHYSSHSLVFYKSELDEDKTNWWVQTPFNPNGADASAFKNGEKVDYEWVEFRVNLDQKSDGGKYLLNKWTSYKPRKGDFKYDKTKTIGNTYNPTMTLPELIDLLNRTDAPYDSDGKIVVTAFVNEYYYEKHPFTGEYQTDLWTQFVDQPMRTMCILSDIKHSSDFESCVINSSFTIQQHSIQSVYNVNNIAETNLQSAWGCEYENDTRESICDTYVKEATKQIVDPRGNSDSNNGRLNSMIEWGLMGASNNTYVGDNTIAWSTYLNLVDDDENKSLMQSSYLSPDYITEDYKDPYAYLRYSCMSRNRDNDGDGMIDKDEIRWYMAASNQLISLFLGSYGIEGAARLYQPTPEKWTGQPPYKGSYSVNEKWRQHVLGSNSESATANSNNNVRIVWAEEGMTGSTMAYTGTNDQTAHFSVRCVRNLGIDPNGDTNHGKDITYSDEGVVPDLLIIPVRKKRGQTEDYTGASWGDECYYEVDCRRVNERSLRYYTDRELVLHDENSEAACLYRRFVTAPRADNVDLGKNMSIRQLNLDVTDNKVHPCPEGFRLPNVRELAVISYFFDYNDVKQYTTDKHAVSRTYFSFGYEGMKFAPDNHWGWTIRGDKGFRMGMVAYNQSVRYPRCVKDVKD